VTKERGLIARGGLLQRKNSEANSQNNKMAAVQSKSNELPAAIVSPRRGLWLALVLTPWRLSLFQLLGPIFGLVVLVSPNEFFSTWRSSSRTFQKFSFRIACPIFSLLLDHKSGHSVTTEQHRPAICGMFGDLQKSSRPLGGKTG
jgi:hypothetical protein